MPRLNLRHLRCVFSVRMGLGPTNEKGQHRSTLPTVGSRQLAIAKGLWRWILRLGLCVLIWHRRKGKLEGCLP
jgi:hypothetical protein